MWTTSLGERTLKGNEARLVRALAWEMQSRLAGTMSYAGLDAVGEQPTGIDAFDRLTLGQQAVALSVVAQALLDPNTPSPPRTAARDATILAIFHVEDDLVAEAYGQSLSSKPPQDIDSVGFRLAIEEVKLDYANAARELGITAPDLDTAPPEAWAKVADRLADAVLIDRDFELLEDLGSLPPEQRTESLKAMRTDASYFEALPENPKSYRELEPYWSRINRVLGHDVAMTLPPTDTECKSTSRRR